MVSETGILLCLLAFLCVRNDFVQRRGCFVAAMIMWGTARLLTEMSFKLQPSTGQLAYDWGSISATVAAACLFLCLLLTFCACWRRRPGLGHASQSAGPEQEATETRDDSRQDPSERIKKLMEDA